MDYFLSLNHGSKDKRVEQLAKICSEKGIKTIDSNSKSIEVDANTKGILFIEPRAELPENVGSYKYAFGYSKMDLPNYICLSDDDKFIEENNYLTALAMKKILIEKFGSCDKKILIIGWGKLTAQLERVLTDADIYILNFNHHKVPELIAKYGNKAFFEKANLKQFPIIINTIPKQLIHSSEFSAKSTIYELASPPYGIILGEQKLKYEILPGLPGKYFCNEAAKAVFDAIMRFIEKETSRPTIVLCITGSSCSYLKLLPILKDLAVKYDMIPVLSANANLPNRFTDIEKFRKDVAEVCGHNIVTTIAGAEVLSANKKIQCSVVFPATGNTVAKLCAAVTDTCVTMAVKALLRNAKPCILGISTNDALSGNASNIGTLLNRKNYYFIPFGQDDPINKPFSMVCDFSKVAETIDAALKGKQLQPILTSI